MIRQEADRADFHVHLGDRTAEDLYQEAIKERIVALGILDRNIVRIKAQIDVGTYIQKYSNMTILPGVEAFVDLRYPGGITSLELIGLGFDLHHPAIFENFDPNGSVYVLRHIEKVTHQIDFLISEGFKLRRTPTNSEAWKKIDDGQYADTGARLCGIAVADPDNWGKLSSMQDIINHHYEQRPQDKPNKPQEATLGFQKALYWEYFAQGKRGYKNFKPDAQHVIETIHKAGGVALVAHPRFKHYPNDKTVTEVLTNLVDIGVDGVEVWDAGLPDIELVEYVLKTGGIFGGGSGQDSTYYHNRIMGRGEKGIELMYIPPIVLSMIEQRRVRYR